MKSKLLIGLVAALALIVIILVRTDRQKNERMAGIDGKTRVSDSADNSGTRGTDIAQNLPPVVKTGNVDAVADGITADLAADANIAAENDADIDYVNQSATLMNAEGVYNENEF